MKTGFVAQGRRGREPRYVGAAIFLHWTIAVLIALQLVLGWWMNEWVTDHSPLQTKITAVHVSVGLTVLLLVLARIAVRLAHRPPPLSAAEPAWERRLAGAIHALLYVLMLALPLTGWVVAGLRGRPILLWGLPWPAPPGLSALVGSPASKAARHQLAHLHVYILIWILVLAVAIHLAGVVWRQIAHRPVLRRMTPRLGGRI